MTFGVLVWNGARMHCSAWGFVGDQDALEQRYLAMIAEVPESNHVLHAAAKTPDGLLIFDTCPSEETYRAFFGPEGPASALFEKHGLVPTTREDHPVIRAYGARSHVDEASLYPPALRLQVKLWRRRLVGMREQSRRSSDRRGRLIQRQPPLLDEPLFR